MHDSQLEDRLRSVLRTEGDRVPLTVELHGLEAELANRRRARRSRRLGLLAAAIGIVAFGLGAAALNGWLPVSQVATTPQPDGCTPLDPDAPVFGLLPPADVRVAIVRAGVAYEGDVVSWQGFGSGDGSAGTWPADRVAATIDIPSDTPALTVTAPSGTCLVGLKVLARPAFDVEAETVQLQWLLRVGPSRELSFRPPVIGLYDLLVRAEFHTTDGSNAWSETAFGLMSGSLGQGQSETPPDRLPPLSPPPGTIAFDMSSPRTAPSGEAGVPITHTVGRFAWAPEYGISIVCLGPGGLQYSIGSEAGGDAVASATVPCNGVIEQTGISVPGAPGEHDVFVTVDSSTAWHVIGTTQGDLSGAVLPIMRASVSGAFEDPIPARDGCGTYVFEPESDPEAALESCARTAWPDMDEQPVLAVKPGADVALEIESGGWTIVDAEVLAAPLDEVGRDTEPAPQIQLHDHGPEVERLVVPVTLEEGSWVLRVNLVGRGDPDRFVASMFVRLEVRSG